MNFLQRVQRLYNGHFYKSANLRQPTLRFVLIITFIGVVLVIVALLSLFAS